MEVYVNDISIIAISSITSTENNIQMEPDRDSSGYEAKKQYQFACYMYQLVQSFNFLNVWQNESIALNKIILWNFKSHKKE